MYTARFPRLTQKSLTEGAQKVVALPKGTRTLSSKVGSGRNSAFGVENLRALAADDSLYICR